MVLRYAVPALGLVVVAVIGLTVFRRGQLNSSPEMVATSRKAETPAVAQETKPPDNYTFALPDKSASVSPAPEPRRGRVEAEPPAPPVTTPAATPATNTPTDLSKEAPVAKTESTAVATAAPPAAAPKPAETTDEARKQDAEEQKKVAQERPTATPQAERERDFRAGAVAPAGVGTTRRAAKREDAAQNRAGEAPLQLGEKDGDDSETRTVAGRRFRKQRGMWVDTAYAGGATTDFTRGSEQYRGLVADEPEIKKIADQLDGQIIVVWKGRPYRIR
jgi:hypothetical protein